MASSQSGRSSAQFPPVPPTDLIARVVQPFSPDQVDEVRKAFHSGGRQNAVLLDHALAAIGRRLTDFERVLDFGCGPCRIIRHLGEPAATVDLHGVDIDRDMIAWSSENVPYATFAVGPHEPPLPYEDGFFDLVYNHSVFTHIDAHRQDLWLAELRRVLRPGGIALLTVHSTRQFNEMVAQMEGAGEDPERYRAAIERDGIVFIADDHFIGTTHPDWYHSTFHAPWYVYEHWREFLDVRAYIHMGAITQDMVVLERRPDGVPAEPAIRRAPAAAPAPAVPPPAATAQQPAGGAAAQGSLRAVAGKAKRRLLRGERERMARHEAELRELHRALDALRAERDELRAATVRDERALAMIRAGLYAQGERVSIVERELRDELTALRAGQARSST